MKSSGPRQLLRLAAAGASLVVPIESVREILEVGAMTAMPNAPAFLRGVMNLRGAVVPVIDLAARCGLPPAVVARRSSIVVVEAQGDALQERVLAGLLVDAVYEVLEHDPQRLEPVPAFGIELPAQFVHGMVRQANGQYAALLSLEQLLAPSQLAEQIGS